MDGSGDEQRAGFLPWRKRLGLTSTGASARVGPTAEVLTGTACICSTRRMQCARNLRGTRYRTSDPFIQQERDLTRADIEVVALSVASFARLPRTGRRLKGLRPCA